jgi:hypothetical protein
MDLLEVAKHAERNPQPPSQESIREHGNLIIQPLDVFSLPFRKMHLHEPLEFLAEQYGVTYETRY